MTNVEREGRLDIRIKEMWQHPVIVEGQDIPLYNFLMRYGSVSIEWRTRSAVVRWPTEGNIIPVRMGKMLDVKSTCDRRIHRYPQDVLKENDIILTKCVQLFGGQPYPIDEAEPIYSDRNLEVNSQQIFRTSRYFFPYIP